MVILTCHYHIWHCGAFFIRALGLSQLQLCSSVHILRTHEHLIHMSLSSCQTTSLQRTQRCGKTSLMPEIKPWYVYLTFQILQRLVQSSAWHSGLHDCPHPFINFAFVWSSCAFTMGRSGSWNWHTTSNMCSIYMFQQVSEGDVNEALRLMKMSKVVTVQHIVCQLSASSILCKFQISLEETAGDDTTKLDPITAVYMVREF